MSWGMSYSRVFWLFYQILHFTPLFVNPEGCKNMVFKVLVKGKTLENHVFEMVEVTDDAHCESLCFLDDRCISYNYYRSAGEEKYMCELSDSDHFMHPGDLVDRPGVIYRSAQNTCDCPKNSKCRYNFVDNTHRCECLPGFTGDQCQTKWLRVANSTEVCIGGKNNQFGRFTIPVACHVLNFKLVYVSGGGISWADGDTKAYWGTTNRHNNKDLNLHITDADNNRISPPPDFPLTGNTYMIYQLPGVTNMDPELTFPELSPPLAVTAGKEFRIWVDEDLNNIYEEVNEGQTRADVWIKKY
ncbi:uncharacterized protein LOC116296085 [Actinia tenebrosa]|uniref:Uncharacterized protein LOC116296085 n=1 Tax=Actinia tenebrosa TaxID=6105 RepID=A0A6P8HX53_ACTTE|nr:uncharacterized protein LOC116296085 [Actinia tenebrosa]